MKSPLPISIPLLLAFSGLALAAESPTPETPPKGLAASDWSSIRAAYEAGRHAAHRQDDGALTARNPGQQWNTKFDGKGFTVTPDHGQWTWGLELIGYGERTLVSASSSITHEGGKLTCPRDENLTEWFINDTRGLEQGWTIHSRSVDSLPAIAESDGRVSPVSSNLTLTLALRGSLHAQVSPDSSSVAFQTSSGSTVLTYGGLKAWDADGKSLAVRFEDVGENAIRIAVDEQYARYPITIDPVAQQAFLKASNTGENDYFGSSVAISGDTVVVGADGESANSSGVNGDQSNNSAGSAGAAYVFVRSGGSWSQQAYLKASNTSAQDRFGRRVAISGDTIAVGAFGEDSSSTGVNGDQNNDGSSDSGAVYVFVRSGLTWSQQAYLKASNTGTIDNFGSSVALSSDTLIVGASGEDSAATGIDGAQGDNSSSAAGAVYIFARSGGAWVQQAYLKASNTGTGDQFGQAVAVAGDTVVIGASSEDSNAGGIDGNQSNNSFFDSGAAYVFVNIGGIWSQQAYMKASNPGILDAFGCSVAISAGTIVVGASGEFSSATGVNGDQSNNSAQSAGAAYVFVQSGGIWSQQAYLKASNTTGDDYFGTSVAISGNTIAVGASSEASSATGVNGDQNNFDAPGSGAAYLFVRSGGVWSQQAYLKASNTGYNGPSIAGDGFGAAIAISGDTVLVGANNEASSTTGVNSAPNEAAFYSGAAYVFDLNAVAPSPEIAIQQAGTDIATTATKTFGPSVVGSTTDLIFTILNTGTADLTLTGTPKVAVTGSPDFTVTAQPASPITGPSGSSVFTVRFTPTGSGLKEAALSILNNDGDENPFVINLTGTALSFSADSDNDGLSDASEFNMAALGFNWQVNQSALVAAFFVNASGAGLFTASQVQAMNTDTPLIARNPATGKFKLTMDWKKSTNLTNFFDFPAPAGSAASITPQGDLEFEFPSTDNAAFFRIEVE